MNAKSKLEYNCVIRVGSGDSCAVTHNGEGRYFVGAVHLNEDETEEFLALLKKSFSEARTLKSKNPA